MFDGRGGRRPGAGYKPPARMPRRSPAVSTESAPGPAPKRARTAAGLYAELAPLARQQGTLIAATELEFRVLIDLVLLQQQLVRALRRRRAIDDQWFKLQQTHDTVMRRLEVKFRSFLLAPMGRPLVEPETDRPPTTLAALKAQRAGAHAVRH